MTAVLVLSGVQRAYPGGRGLKGVDLAIHAGEIYGLLGPNGAGKTSLVRAACGRLRLDGGTVTLLGRDPAREPAARAMLGIVPQEIALYEELPVADNLELLARLAGLSRAAARAAVPAALARIELADRARSPVATLSGGQKRRVNLAAATLHGPRLLLLDEPTVGVDLPARERIHGMLRDLRREGMAILLATHDLEQAHDVCDRLGVLVDGRIVAEGAPAELIGRWFPEGTRELAVTLSAGADDVGRATLARLGLAAGSDALTWHGRLDGGLDRLPALVRELEGAGVGVRDAAVREASLRGVYRAVAGREFAA